MADFVLQCESEETSKTLSRAAEFLRFQPDFAVQTLAFKKFTLVIAAGDSPECWGPLDTGDLLIALIGRIALDGKQWDSAHRIVGPGGLATKWIAARYRDIGSEALTVLNGNFSLILYDRIKERLFLVTDPAGAFPVFRSIGKRLPAFGSHADALALAIDEDQIWDETSLAEFAMAGIVTPPYTYYKNINSVPSGHLIEISLQDAPRISERSYFQIEYRPQSGDSEESLAEELADTLKRSVQRRSSPRFGVTAVALSGGLDSRAILAATADRSELFAFCCFDQENYEFAIARRIAESAGVKLVPFAWNFDFYADTAELGLRISGGMGSFANNHFLGLAGRLRELGVENLLTGCYCDYLFKGLVLNRRSSGLLRREKLASFSEQYYFNHFPLQEEASRAVRQRWLDRFPPDLRSRTDEAGAFEIEKLRTFPLWHEGDNAQRLVPQRVLHNYLPFADRELIELYCRIPYQYKLNRSLFKKAAARICGPALTRIPDANTGARVDASLLREEISSNVLRLKQRFSRFNSAIATEGSWPDWPAYIQKSSRLSDWWEDPVSSADDLFRAILQPHDIRSLPSDYRGRDAFLVVRLLTLKLWIKQRCSKEP